MLGVGLLVESLPSTLLGIKAHAEKNAVKPEEILVSYKDGKLSSCSKIDVL